MKNKVTLLCGTLAGACCLFGASFAIDAIDVSAETTSVSMVAGAATRKDLENPGLKFTANIANYIESVDYGMLILPEEAFTKYTFDNDYVDVLNAAGKTYINKLCAPYEISDGQWQIACSIVDIFEDNYTRQFVGVAYTLVDGSYDYAEVNMLDNARSVTYVAQMALQYEADLTADETYALETFANPKCLLEETVEVDGIEDAGLTFGGEATVQDLNNALSVDIQNKLDPNKGSMSVITKTAYTGITEIKFDAKSGTTNSWWGIGIIDSAANASIYKQNLGALGSHSTNGEWATFTYTISGTSWSLTSTSGLSKSGSFTSGATSAETTGYYVYVLGARGETFSETIQFDNFSITAGGTTYTDDFNASINGGLFNTDANMQSVQVSVSGIELPEFTPTTNNALSVDIQNKLNSDTGKASVITKVAYTGITEIKFDAKSGTTNSWWGIGIIDSAANASIYKQNLGALGSHSTNGEWATFTYTISGTSWSLTSTSGLSKSGSFTSGATSAETTGYYVYVLGARGETFSETIQFDNFSITAGGTTYTDDFNASINGGLFNTDANMQSVTVSSESEDAYDFETLLASGDVNSVLYNGGYAYVQSGAVSLENLPASSLAITGSFTYTITGDKAFALVLGGTESGMDYLYIDGTTLAFYNGVTLKKSVALTSATNTITVAVTAGGRVCVSVNDGEFVAMGNVTAAPSAAFKAVALGGAGEVAITAIDVSVYAYNAAPAYLSADEIEFTAYAPVTVKDWGSGAVNPI